MGLAACMLLNQLSTSCVLFHWCTPVSSLHFAFILSSILLLTFLRLLEAGFIILHLILFGNPSLWSLMQARPYCLENALVICAFPKNITFLSARTSSTENRSCWTSAPIEGNTWHAITRLDITPIRLTPYQLYDACEPTLWGVCI